MGPLPGGVPMHEAELLIGLTLEEAQAHAAEQGYRLYVTGNDGVVETARASYDSRRVRVALLDGLVAAVRPG